MRVAFLAVLADDSAVVVLVFPQESLRVVVAVDVDLSEGVVCRRLHAALVDACLQPWQQQLQPATPHSISHQMPHTVRVTANE